MKSRARLRLEAKIKAGKVCRNCREKRRKCKVTVGIRTEVCFWCATSHAECEFGEREPEDGSGEDEYLNTD
jgi:hypothetical protein